MKTTRCALCGAQITPAKVLLHVTPPGSETHFSVGRECEEKVTGLTYDELCDLVTKR